MTVAELSRPEKIELAVLLAERERRESRKKIFSYYPETGLLSRKAYPKHMQFFVAGAVHRERAAMAANRVGKTEGMGGYELVLHLTGLYPDWWQGRRFDRAVDTWAAGSTRQTTRDILQAKLCGTPGVPSDLGTGMIPGAHIVGKPSAKPGVPNAVETVHVRHVSGGISTLTFKSYDQGREAFEGTQKDVILLDEEPDEGVYAECLLRTADTGRGAGILMLTFTPLLGLSKVVLMFMPGGKAPVDGISGGRFMVSATWDDAPHLSDKEKRELEASIPPHQRNARTKGIPQLGAGAIYPIDEEQVKVADFSLPKEWPRLFALDVGWNRTAVLWAAHDRESDVIYLYSHHYEGEALPPIHAAAIKARGKWIPGKIDPAARGRAQRDGLQLMKEYQDLGLNLSEANNAREAGILEVWTRLVSGRLKIFASLGHWFEEFRIYRRDEKGQIVKENDHLLDDTRYICLGIMDAVTQAFTTEGVAEIKFPGRF